MSDQPPPLPAVGATVPARHREMSQLPPAVAARLAFDRAAPRRLRNANLPELVQEDLRALWNGIVADVFDEVAGLRRTKAFRRDAVERSLQRVADRLLQTERAVIVTAVHYPLRSNRPWKHMATAGAGGGASAVAEEVAAFGSAGTATTVAIVSAIVGEVFETYVAASARTNQYLEAKRSPDPAIIVTDLAEASGYGDSAGRRASPHVAREAATWLGQELVRRTASRFARSLVPGIGIAAGAGISAAGVHKVTRLPLREVTEEEVLRLAEEVVADPDAYARSRAEFLAITASGADDPEG